MDDYWSTIMAYSSNTYISVRLVSSVFAISIFSTSILHLANIAMLDVFNIRMDSNILMCLLRNTVFVRKRLHINSCRCDAATAVLCSWLIIIQFRCTAHRSRHYRRFTGFGPRSFNYPNHQCFTCRLFCTRYTR